MIKFADNKIVSNPGSRIHIIYAPEVQKDGTVILIESGKEDTDEYIDSFREETEISTIIKRFQGGDVSVINQKQGFYADVTKMPKTYAEMLQLRIDSKKAYDELPTSVKEKFDNDEFKFFATAGSEDWFKKLGVIEEVNEKIKEGEVEE